MDLCEGRNGGEEQAYCNTAIATETVDYEGVALVGHGCFDDSSSVMFAPAPTLPPVTFRMRRGSARTCSCSCAYCADRRDCIFPSALKSLL